MYCISVKRHGMIDFTLCMYSVYMRDGFKYYKYEEVSTGTVWVCVGIEMACFRCRGIMILDFISVGFRPCSLPPVSSYIRFGLRGLGARSIKPFLPYIVKG